MQAPPEHFTLKQVADSIRKTIEQRYNRLYWVTAEMHKLNETRKGHCYPELVQKEDGQIVVEMRGTIWKTNFDRIRNRFMEVVKEPLRDGLELLFQVRIVYHPIYNLGLEIVDIDPNYALGALQRERQETLEKLNREGILNANQQLQMALVPKRLAIISQSGSKGYSDFQLLLNGHPKKYRFDTFLFEATLQGDAAIESISAQLKRIERIKHHFDAVLIVRGGGGEIGMHCYNNYELAKAIATFPLPVLTGIGHSTNMTVCEMVAYNNGITPSDLAYYFLRIFEELDEPLDQALLQLPGLAKQLVQQWNNQLNQELKLFQSETKRHLQEQKAENTAIVKDFQRVVRFGIQEQANQLNQNRMLLKPLSERYLQRINTQLEQSLSLAAIHTRNTLQHEDRSLENHRQQLIRQSPKIVETASKQLETISRQLQLVDPIHVLRRGYSIVTNQKGVLSAGNIPEKGEEIRIIQAEMTVIADVKQVNPPPVSPSKGGGKKE